MSIIVSSGVARMTILSEDRLSDSPYIEMVSKGWTESEGSTIRPAESNWHMVFVKANGRAHPLMVGPLTSSGLVSWGAGGEILWIKFKLGTYMPHMPVKNFLNNETEMPAGAFDNTFWLKGSTWQFPSFDNVETFVSRLIRDEILVRDAVVDNALKLPTPDVPARTVRHRFLRTTGMSQSQIHQFARAKRAEAMLKTGTSILDTVFEAGYFDQPHLTRSMKLWIGYTPAEIIRLSKPPCHSVQDPALLMEYDASVLAASG